MLNALAALFAIYMMGRYGPAAVRALSRPGSVRPFPVVAVINFLLALAILVVGLTVAIRTIISR